MATTPAERQLNVVISDVRGEMPNYARYHDHYDMGAVCGLAIHHTASAHPASGLGLHTASQIFDSHVCTRGWLHGGYHYLISPSGTVEYALDERIAGYHAGFIDPTDEHQLEYGQFWNRHYLAICLIGWFENSRVYSGPDAVKHQIPDYFTKPTAIQFKNLILLIETLRGRYDIPVENVRGHRELEGSNTRCPGENVDLAGLRENLLAREKTQ
jgi:hypothetical protein